MAPNTDNPINHSVNRRESIADKFIKIFIYSLFTLAAAAIVYLLAVLLIVIILKDPQFSIQEAEIGNLKLTTSSIDYSIRLTIVSTNPNKKVGVYYNGLVIYASYKDESFTPQAFIAPFDTVYGETKPASVSLVVDQQPLVPYLADQLRRDQENGKLELEFNVMGYLSYKMGKFWVWNRFRFTMKCPTVMKIETKTPLSFTTQGTVECSMK